MSTENNNIELFNGDGSCALNLPPKDDAAHMDSNLYIFTGLDSFAALTTS